MTNPIQVYDGNGFNPDGEIGREHLRQSLKDCSDVIGWDELKKKEGGAIRIVLTVSGEGVDKSAEITRETYKLLCDRMMNKGKQQSKLSIEFFHNGHLKLAHEAQVRCIYESKSYERANVLASRVSRI